ncbi:MAG: MFS transporter, partial [Candidatus Heimdallarchaeaceae archaeon]
GQLGMVGTISASVILLVLGFITDYLPFPENFFIFQDNLNDYNFRFMMFCGAFLFAFATIFVFTLTETNLFKQKNKVKSFLEIIKDKPFSKLILVTLVWWFFMSFLWPLSPYVLKRIDVTSAQVAILSAVFSAAMAVGQIAVGKIAAKIGRRMTMFLGIVSLCTVPLVLAFSTSWYLVLIANIFGGFGNGALMVSISAEILDLAGSDAKGAYSGTFNLMLGIATFCGSFLCGILFEFFTKELTFTDNEFGTVLRIFLITITIVRLLASIPVLVYALRKKAT